MSNWVNKIQGNWKKYATIFLSASGIVVSFFLALVVEKEPVLGCTISGTPLDCTKVLSTEFSTFLGIPVSILSAFWFIVLFSVFMVDYKNNILIACLSILGFVSVLYFIFLELFVIHYICLYCTIAHIIGITLILIISPSAIKNSYETMDIKIKNFNN